MTSTGGQGVTHVYGVFGFSLTTIFTQIFVRLGGKQYSILKYMVGLPLSSFIKPLYILLVRAEGIGNKISVCCFTRRLHIRLIKMVYQELSPSDPVWCLRGSDNVPQSLLLV